MSSHNKAYDEPVLTPLVDIHANPYQPRTQDDPSAVAEVAASIYRNGLLQIPSARQVNGHVELAFGHTRRAAFELLASTGIPDQGIEPDPRFASMPVYLRELDDRQMFEMAVAENVKRRDLNPIERAAAMQRYMTAFEASSRETAELFGVNDATVRGMVRLLQLPDQVQHKIASGDITQGEARTLLVLDRLDPNAAARAAGRIADGQPLDLAIRIEFGDNKQVVTLWEAWRKGQEPLAGDGLWPLGLAAEKFPNEYLLEMRVGDVRKALGLDAQARSFLDALKLRPAEELIDEFPNDVEQIERTEHLLRPPACLSCSLHAVIDDRHLCGFKACYERKAKAWRQAELARLSKKLSIPIYDRKSDGKALTLSDNQWDRDFKANDQLVAEKHGDLRLEIHVRHGQHYWTQSPNVCVVVVGEKAAQLLAARQAQVEKGQSGETDWEGQRIRRQATDKFYQEQVPARFAVAFKGLDNLAALCALTGSRLPAKGHKKTETLAALRTKLADHALRNLCWSAAGDQGPSAFARHVKKVALTWGIELPADWLDIARQYEPVSTETPGEVGKK